MCEKLEEMISTMRPNWADLPWATSLLARCGWQLALAAAFLIPIKLTLGYFALFPLILLWLLGGDLKIVRNPLVTQFLLFVLIAGLSGILGIAPLRSITSCLRVTLSLLAIPAVAAVTKNPLHLIFAAIVGQSIAALVTCLELGLGVVFPPYFTGPVTESGQIAIVLPLVAGIIFALRSNKIPHKYWAQVVAIVSFLLMMTALVLNAKRGPFIACFLGLGLLFILRSPRLLLPLALGYLAMVFVAPSLHERLAESAEHFFIAGGRNEMWSIGGELISRYPLGIGLHNSPYLQKFSVQVPPEHNHFHSNVINILVETGWFGLAAFLTWYVYALIFCFKRRAFDPYAFGMLASLVSWQIAGLVEYNMGDSEVFVLILIQLGGFLGNVITASKVSAQQKP